MKGRRLIWVGRDGLLETTKREGATTTYAIDLAKWIPPGDSISALAVDVPAGLTEVSHAVDGNVLLVKLTGGTVGEDYECVLSVTMLPSGTVEPISMRVKVRA